MSIKSKLDGVKDGILKNYSRRERGRFPFAYALLAFPVMQFIVFYIYVNLSSFVIAFQDSNEAFTLYNFQRVFSGFFGENGKLRMELLRSMITWAVGMFINFPLSVLFSYVLFKRIPCHMAFRVLLYVPGMLGSVVIIKLYKYLLFVDGPVINLLQALNVNISEELLTKGFFGYEKTQFMSILIYGVWLGVGGNTIVLTGALLRIPNEIFEAAKLDGVGFFREFFELAIPMIYPTLNTLIIFSLAGIFTADNGTFLFSQEGGSASTIGYRLFYEVYLISNAGVGNGNTAFGYPAALGMVISAVTIPIVLILRPILEKHLEAVGY